MEKQPKNNLPLELEKEPAMGLPYFTSFCCCMGLEVGAKVVGFLHLISSIALVIMCSIYVHEFHELSKTVEDAGDHLYSSWRNIAAFITAVSVVHVLLACALLYGIYKRNTTALRAWVIIMSILWGLSVIANLTMLIMYGASGSGAEIFLDFLLAVIAYGLVCYFILCVQSYYLMVKSSEDMEGPYRKPY